MPRFPGEATVSLAEGSQEAILAAAAESVLAESAGGALAAGLFPPGMGPFPLAGLVGGESPALAREVEMPTDGELKGLTRTLRQSRDVIRLLIVRLNDTARELARTREMIALRGDTFAKGSSQRSRSLGVDAGGGKGEGATGDGRAVANGEATADGVASDESAAAGGSGDKTADDAVAGGDGADARGRARDGGGKKQKGRPKRGDGCMAKTTEGMNRVTLRRELDAGLLADLMAKGRLRRLPDGRYTVIVPISAHVAIDIEFDRFVDGDGTIFAADSASASRPIPRSAIGAGLMAQLLYLRFDLSMPAPRICKMFETDELHLTKQRIYRLCTQLGLSLSRPLVNRMLGIVLKKGKLQSDESFIKVSEEKRRGHDSVVVWLVRTSELLGVPPVVVLNYTCSREAAKFAEMIRGFSGTLMADCYPAYKKALEELADAIELCACLQHARSNFADVVKSLKSSRKRMGEEAWEALPANRVIRLFGDVFEAEDRAPRGVEARRAHRAREVRPLLDKLFEEIEGLHAKLRERDQGKLAQAIRYAVKYKERFYRACDDPLIPLTNSACEREFAQLGVIRSNSHQWDTALGAATLCNWFSVVRTARLNDADTLCYLEFLLEEARGALESHGDWHWFSGKALKGTYDDLDLPEYGDLSYLDDYMPWSKRFKEYAGRWHERRRQLLIEVAGALAAAATGDSGEVRADAA